MMQRAALICAGLLAVFALLTDNDRAMGHPFPVLHALSGSAPISTGPGDTPPAPLTAMAVSDLAFLAGRWEGAKNDMMFDEVWMPPRGRMMLGSYRLLKDGQPPLMLMMIIEERADGIIFRMKQFDPDFVSLGQSFREYHLIALNGQRAVFVRSDIADNPERLIYHRTGTHQLIVEVHYKPKENRPRKETYVMRLANHSRMSGWSIPIR